MSASEKLFWHRLALAYALTVLAMNLAEVKSSYMSFIVWSVMYLTGLTLRLVYLAGRRKGQARE